MKKVMIVLGIILIGLAGCGKSEKEYVGEYSTKSPGDRIKKQTLEIKLGHIWKSRTEYKSHLMPDSIYSGRWEIVDGKIILHGSSSRIAIYTIEAELKGDELIDRHGSNNKVFIKQN